MGAGVGSRVDGGGVIGRSIVKYKQNALYTCKKFSKKIKCYIKIDKNINNDKIVHQRLQLNNELRQNETADIRLYLFRSGKADSTGGLNLYLRALSSLRVPISCTWSEVADKSYL